MKITRLLLLLTLLMIALAGCGGGGGGGGPSTATLTGRILNVVTGGPPNPRSSIQVGSNTVLSDQADGSFQLTVAAGTTAALVDSLGLGFGTFTFNFPAASNVTDVGDLWIGPEKVTVTGTVRNASNSAPVSGAEVVFAGRTGLTNASGVFSLTSVAYSSSTQVAFWGIIGSVRAAGFFKTDFSTQPNLAVSGVVTLSDILITPLSDPNPPPTPFNIWGIVSAPGGASGSIIRLKDSGNDIRVFNVGSDGKYFFFVAPGSYTVVGEKGASFSTPVPVSFGQPNTVTQVNVNIP